MTNNKTQHNSKATDDSILLEEEALLGKKPAGKAASAAASTGSQATGAGQTSSPVPTEKLIEKFHIPAIVPDRYPELIPLIVETESMDDEEREYWFQMIPIMTNDQIEKLKEILVSEKEQLAKLDAEYEAELKKIDEKHLAEWKEFEMKQKKEEITKKEKANEENEKATEEDLLKKLQNT